MEETMEYTSSVSCYQCVEAQKSDPAVVIKLAVTGPIFPFCCEDHKKIWGDNHFGKIEGRSRYHTIEECQKKIMEWRDRIRAEKNGKPQTEMEIFR